jgi:coenzyme F420-0:L-glutamate ligase/coenzyme F420-1:gamma-L-glutamate ligase
MTALRIRPEQSVRPASPVASTVTASAVRGLPEVSPGDDLAALLLAAGARPSDGDVVVVAHKVVSKAEGRIRSLRSIEPGERAAELAPTLAKDPRLIQAILDETTEIVRAERGVLICRTRGGLVCANAGVDASNAPDDDTVVLLPLDADASARALRARLKELGGTRPAVVITDSFGRAWRVGQCDVALGCAGLRPLDDWRGRHDARGRELVATWIAIADQVAAAADLARRKDSHEPVVIVGGLERHVAAADGPGAAALVRPLAEDLFR